MLAKKEYFQCQFYLKGWLCIIRTNQQFKEHNIFQSLLNDGTINVTVCRNRFSPPVQSSIQVIYKECLIACSQYLGVTALCFLPPINGTCPAQLPTNPTPCTDQDALRARLVSLANIKVSSRKIFSFANIYILILHT